MTGIISRRFCYITVLQPLPQITQLDVLRSYFHSYFLHRKRQRNQRRPGRASHTTPNVLLTRENGHNHMSSPSDHLSSDSPGSDKCLRPERKGNSVQGVYHYDFVVCGFNRMDSR